MNFSLELIGSITEPNNSSENFINSIQLICNDCRQDYNVDIYMH